MRANRSWPRSSVPNGCCHEGPARRAVKSMSLMGTCHHSGPNTTVRMINAKMAALATAKRWRRKRRHDSRLGGTRLRAASARSATSAVGNARVEPAIDEVCEQIEQNDQAGEDECHRHDGRRVVGENRADEQRSDAGDAEDLLGDDGAA